MKVLFAVNNEDISEAIVKKYQKKYKEIISYKNVYYFNAILKEIQKDKTYDRIVVSEDLEQFTNTSYEQMDKFIFEKLDSISDEAENSKGKDIPIILICTERRNKSEEILVKLFGIGIYNAIIGNDRSVDEVCRLINKPRLKKEAKTYYQIDSEKVNYKAENEDDVSEVEIQNILAHFKRLGKNEKKYIESYNNIAAQYNDKQLKVISMGLPLGVRAVLEEQSPKYQQVMAFNKSVSENLRKTKNQKNNGLSEKLLTNPKRIKALENPIVVPSSMKSAENAKKLTRKPKKEVITEAEKVENIKPVDSNNFVNEVDVVPAPVSNIKVVKPNKPAENNENTQPLAEIEAVTPKRGRGRPRKNPLPVEEETIKPKRGRGRPRKNPLPEEIEDEEEAIRVPNLYENQEIPENEENEKYATLPGIEEDENEEEYATLPGIDVDESEEEFGVLPGTDDDEGEEEFNALPGIDEDESEEEIEMLPAIEELEDEDDDEDDEFVLPGDNLRNVGMQDEPIEPIVENNYNMNRTVNTNNQGVIRPVASQQSFIEKNNDYTDNYNIDLSDVLQGNKKVVAFVGTSKNGTSFIVNNVAELLSSMGVNVAILDTTKNRNSYYIYTKNEEELRRIAMSSLENLENGVARGIRVNNNLSVYTSLPNDDSKIENIQSALSTLVRSHSVVLIDCDFDTPKGYFSAAQEIYLVQTMDVLTIQPLTAFLKELVTLNILEEHKIRIIINKYVKIRGIVEREIVGGMAYYNAPDMTYQSELFDKTTVKYMTIPFEEETYVRYLEGLINCEISLKGYSKIFMQNLRQLGNMIYPIATGKAKYTPPALGNTGTGAGTFSKSMNNTLNQMKRNY